MKGELRRRGALRGPKGCVAADHPLAAQAALATLVRGGNAIDAAVAAAAVMTVIQPHYSHLGGDLFAMLYDGATWQVDALNSSGPAPSGASLAQYQALGAIPDTGALAVTIPGCVDGWWALHLRAGRLPWAEVLAPAEEYARDGFPASRQLVRSVREQGHRIVSLEAFTAIFGDLTEGRRVVQPDLARTFAAIRRDGPRAFYEGEVAEACVAALVRGGAMVSQRDWRGPARWETPVSAVFAGYRVHSQPPPSSGFVLPLALRLYESLAAGETGLGAPVLQHAALAQALLMRSVHGCDPAVVPFDAQALIDNATPGAIGVASPAGQGTRGGDTTYLLAVDAEGNAVSLIQSVYAAFGSGLMPPGTGIFLNNRMTGFSLREGARNVLAPGKRPLHTLSSYVVTGRDGRLRAVGGTPGALQQPQTNLQVLDAVLARGEDVQDAIDAPRWSLGQTAPFQEDYRKVVVEPREPDTLTPAFRDAGIAVESGPAWPPAMGRAYLAVIEEGGVAVGADPRGEGLAIVV